MPISHSPPRRPRGQWNDGGGGGGGPSGVGGRGGRGVGRSRVTAPTDRGGEPRPPWVGLEEEPSQSEWPQSSYVCKVCKQQMAVEEKEMHHRPRPKTENDGKGHPCEMVKCGLCRMPFLRGLAKEHRQTCGGKQEPAVEPLAGGAGGNGAGAVKRAVPSGAASAASLSSAAGRPVANGGGAGAADPFMATRVSAGPSIVVGDMVLIKGSQVGAVLYVGAVEGLIGTTVGVKLDEPTPGAGDGKLNGVRYFRCTPGHAAFCSIGSVQRAPSPVRTAAAPAKAAAYKGSAAAAAARASGHGKEEARSSAGGGAAGGGKRRGEKWERTMLALVGLASVKERICGIRNSLEVNERRSAAGGRAERPQNLCIIGNPGSGRTQVAKVIGNMLSSHDNTRTRASKLLMPSRQEVFHPHSMSRTQELLEKVLHDARGGVLVLDDLSEVAAPSDREAGGVSSTGKELIELFACEFQKASRECNALGGIVLVVTGDCTLMTAVLRNCSTLRSLLSNPIELPDLNASEITDLMDKMAKERGFKMEEGVRKSSAVTKYVTQVLARAGKDHRNVHLASTLLDDAVSRQTERVHLKGTITKDSLLTLLEVDVMPSEEGTGPGSGPGSAKQLEACMEELENVAGLSSVKEFVKSMRAQLMLDAERRAAGLPTIGQGTLHMVFSGNPGTGKTTVARIVAKMFAALGVLRKGQLVEVDRSALVAGYSGQTAIKTKEVVDSALGGILFVDEAYSLVNGDRDAFGKEALDTMLKMMEDYRDDLVVIFAGYKKEMQVLMQSNSGLASRFPTWLDFKDYTAMELHFISQSMLKEGHMKLTPGANELLLEAFEMMSSNAKLQAELTMGGDDQSDRPSNGRAVRNLLEMIQRKQALRLAEQKTAKTMDDLTTIKEPDVMPCVAHLIST